MSLIKFWAAQQSHYPELLSDEACKTIRRTIERQRELKPQPVGKCTLTPPQKKRAPKALSSAQRARILEEVNNLKVGRSGQAQKL